MVAGNMIIRNIQYGNSLSLYSSFMIIAPILSSTRLGQPIPGTAHLTLADTPASYSLNLYPSQHFLFKHNPLSAAGLPVAI
jgi:hypothetical protein